MRSQLRSGDCMSTRSGRTRRITRRDVAAQSRASTRPVRRDSRGNEDRGPPPRPPPRSAPRAAWAPSRHARHARSPAPPASPSVTMQYVTSMPESVSRATVPAKPKSTSSGWAVTTSARSTPESSRAFHMCATLSLVPDSPFDARELVGLLADDDRRRVVRCARARRDHPRRRAGRHGPVGPVGRRGPCNASSTPASWSAATTAPSTCSGRRSRSRPEPKPSARPARPSTTTSPRMSPACSACSCATDGSRRSRPCEPSGSWCSTGSRNGSSRAGTTRRRRVNLMLAAVHPDTAALRRYLVDEGIMGRDHGRVLAGGRHVRPGVARVGTVRGWHWFSSIATFART